MNEIKASKNMALGNADRKVEIDLIHCESNDFRNVTEFWFKINKKISCLKISINVSEFVDIISVDEKFVIKKNEWNFLVGYENVKENQLWKFTFSGKINDTKQRFTNKIEYKI